MTDEAFVQHAIDISVARFDNKKYLHKVILYTNTPNYVDIWYTRFMHK